MACHTSQQELLTSQDNSSLAVLCQQLETDVDVAAAAVVVTVVAVAAVAVVVAAAVTSWLS